jgi:hypothetical protein
VAWVDVETPEGKKRLEANYVIGCDGARAKSGGRCSLNFLERLGSSKSLRQT